jgi:DNA-binding transcriptional LysR family regulator
LYLGGGHSGNWTFAKKRTNAVKAVDQRVGVTIRGSLKANNSEVLRDALVAGLGIGLLPDFSLPPPNADGELPLVRLLPDWHVQGFFGDRIYALRPWSAQVPKPVQCLVEYLRAYFALGFNAVFTKG